MAAGGLHPHAALDPSVRGPGSVHLFPQRLYLLLQPELLSLEFPKSELVGVGPAHLVLNGLFERLVTRSELTDTGI